ncbi:MAG: histidine--tRNA ligase [Thermoplasmatota archaeon]
MFEIPRGTRDFIPDEMVKRRFVEDKLRAIFEAFGYREIQTPTFEHLDLFTAKSGESVINEIYAFSDKGGRNLALRPELTAPVMRCYVEKLQMEPKPLKLYYIGNCYRYDRPQKGRYREFMQAGCELIGTNTSEATAELIGLAYSLVNDVGVDEVVLEIGHIGLLRLILKQLSLSEDQTRVLLSLIDKELFDEIPLLLHEYHVSEQHISQFLDIIQHSRLDVLHTFFASNVYSQNELKRLEDIMMYLQSIIPKDSFVLNMGIVRGLDYYTGVVFEIKAPKLGAEKQICGGGEYELISLFGGRETSTSGFALGFDRTILAMELQNATFPSLSVDYFIIPVTTDMIGTALLIAQYLRNKQKKVDVDLMRRGVGKALKYASSIHARKAIIIGPDELKQHMVAIRDMDTGVQEAVTLDTFVPGLSL